MKAKSITDHVRDAVARGLSEADTWTDLARKISLKRFSKRRLAELYQSVKAQADNSRTFDVDGITMQGDHLVTVAMDYGGSEDGSVDDAVKILKRWKYKVTEFN